jgi:hypothetical protein
MVSQKNQELKEYVDALMLAKLFKPDEEKIANL